MINVAICDDEKAICAYMENVLLEIGQTFCEEISVETFYSGEKLCQSLHEGVYYDVIFLDIDLKTMNGIRIGKLIREVIANDITHIVYVSGKDSYAMELFDIRPLNFLIKPLTYEKIQKVFMTALRLLRNNGIIFEYQKGHCFYRIPINNILYFESMGKKIRIIMKDTIEEYYSKLSIIQRQIRGAPFISIHKSYLVNYDHIVEVQYDKVRISNNVILPISQHNRKAVRDKLLQMRQKEVNNNA
ncbi:LytR/AlgR family response regulator transcription factor [Lutispora thermophila]|uniref:Stage 0 sporulation protein A homolog n=1 Tax=Lutispora thermophila DSM 19022 TaxID=1122184 RepID=A0A1M6DQU7_9FIRM|nr:LytTR family DNA-binding domain-containing protein [Lutispora thermophila]SHI75348.1 two component transcriptional regulator, LytTR family [Lutispora thermophila DSM 19022]